MTLLSKASRLGICLLVCISLIHCEPAQYHFFTKHLVCGLSTPGLRLRQYCAPDLSLLQYVLNPSQKVVPLLVLPVRLQLDCPPPVVAHLTVLLCTQLEKEDTLLKYKFNTQKPSRHILYRKAQENISQL